MALFFKNKCESSLIWRKKFSFGLIIALLILLFPFLNFFHLLFSPENNKILLFGNTVNHGYPDNQVFVWFVTSDLISLIYLSAVLFLSFGFWRNFLLPAIVYFLTYPIWMFASDDSSYFSFISSFFGLTMVSLTLIIVKLLDTLSKKVICKNNLNLSLAQIWKEMICDDLYEYIEVIG